MYKEEKEIGVREEDFYERFYEKRDEILKDFLQGGLNVNENLRSEFYKFIKDICGDIFSGNHVMFLKCLDDTTVELRMDYSVSVMEMDNVTKYDSMLNIIYMCSKQDIAIDTFYLSHNPAEVIEYRLNCQEPYNGYYLLNKDTDKIEIYFEKEWYLSLGEYEKAMIKSNFLFSRTGNCWVSRRKFPNIWVTEDVCKRLWLENRGSSGGKSFEEKMQDKAERAENRAERYQTYANNATKRGQDKQRVLDSVKGDIAFFTQPNINSSAGRSFSKRRERMIESYFKGFEEFKKSEYWEDRVEAAMATAESTKPTDKGFLVRKIDKLEKGLKKLKKNLDIYNDRLKRIESGEVLHKANGDVVTKDTVLGWINKEEYQIESDISKVIYYRKCLEELGGVDFNKDNIKKGYKILHKRWDLCEVVGTGPKNFSYCILEGGAKGMGGSSPYADIVKIVSTDVVDEVHPFTVGEKFVVKEWNGDKYVDVEYTISKASTKRVTLVNEFGKNVVRQPKLRKFGKIAEWCICITENLNGTISKQV